MARTQPTVASVSALLARWHPTRNVISPNELTLGSTRKVWWTCPAGDDHVYESSTQAVAKAVAQGRPGCPFCRGLRPSVTNRLDVLYPWLAEQWHPRRNGDLQPSQVVAGSNKPAWWQCPAAHDHEWQAAPIQRLRADPGRGCSFCRNLRPSVSNRLDVLFPALARQWHPSRNGTVTPADVVYGTHDVFWWACAEGPDHEWQVGVYLRTGEGHGCPFCVNRRLSVTNSVAARFPDWAHLFDIQRNPRPADRTLANTEVKVHWRCPVAADHRWSEATGRVAANSWSKGRSGCPACRGLQPSATNNLLNHPALAGEFHPTRNAPLTPSTTVAGSGRKLWWQCARCAHEWQAIGANRLKGRGCPMCQVFTRSILEVALIFELQTIFDDVELEQDKVVLDGRIRHVDVRIDSARLVIELDGSYRHDSRDDQDADKSELLRAHGWHVIRIREQPLTATHPDDVVVPLDPSVKVVTNAVLSRALERGWVTSSAAERIDAYLDDLEPRRLSGALAEMSTRRPDTRLVIPGTPKGPTRRDRWERNYELLLAFFARTGHARPLEEHLEEGVALGAWVGAQRSRCRRGVLQPDRARRLAGLSGWTWDVSQDAWELGYVRLCAYVAERGTARVPVAYRDPDGYPLGTWVRTHRKPGHRKPLTDQQQARLEALPDWTFDNLVDIAFDTGLAALRSFAERHGHVRLARDARKYGQDLPGFCARHRAAFHRGELAADRIAALESVPGWSWRPKEQAWEDGYAALVSYVELTGSALVPSDHEQDSYPLGQWVREQRDRGNRTGDAIGDGDLAPDRRARLEQLPGWSWAPHADTWERYFAALVAFVTEHGHAAVPTGLVVGDLQLGS